jgi:hypothetical protein
MTPILLPTATTTAAALDPAQWGALAALAVLGWRLLAIWLFPYAPCRHCRGSGKHRSGQYWRPCRRCRGTGRRTRLGRRIWNWTRTTDTTTR